MSNGEVDRVIMGTKAEAEAGLLECWREWCRVSQPIVGTAKQLRQRNAEYREAQVRMVQAGALLAWHMNDERARAQEDEHER